MITHVEKKPQPRVRLLQAASHLLMRHSFAQVSVDDICKAAETPKGTFYHHFPSKTDLAVAALEQMGAELKQQLEPVLLSDLPGQLRLKAYADFIYQYHKGVFDTEGRIYGCPVAAVGQETLSEETRIRDLVQSLMHDEEEMLIQTLGDMPAFAGWNTEKKTVLARQIQAMAAGVMYQACLLNDPSVIKRDLWPGLQRLLNL
jgi:TetR/AcrR family transcriptional repressor of nem operon